MCDPVTFPCFSALQFDNLMAKARAEGLELSGEAGEADYKGVTVSWLYNPEREELTLTCTKKPWLYPCGKVNDKLKELVGGS